MNWHYIKKIRSEWYNNWLNEKLPSVVVNEEMLEHELFLTKNEEMYRLKITG